MEPIQTYAEKRFRPRRTFRLFNEKIEIKGKMYNGGFFETEIALKDLRMQKDIIYYRDNFSQTIFVLPGLVMLICVAIFGMGICSRFPLLYWTLLWIALAAIAAGIILGFTNGKKLKNYRYNYESGIAAFDVGELGNKKEDFESFCEQIDRQIKKLKNI
jgi:hypothetical protein